MIPDDYDDSENNNSVNMSPRNVKTTRFVEPSSSGSSVPCSPLNQKNQETSMEKVKKRSIPAVFSRLWNQNKKRDEKLKKQRESSRE